MQAASCKYFGSYSLFRKPKDQILISAACNGDLLHNVRALRGYRLIVGRITKRSLQWEVVETTTQGTLQKVKMFLVEDAEFVLQPICHISMLNSLRVAENTSEIRYRSDQRIGSEIHKTFLYSMLHYLDAAAQRQNGRKGNDLFSERTARCFGAGSYADSKNRIHLREEQITNRPSALYSTGKRPRQMSLGDASH